MQIQPQKTSPSIYNSEEFRTKITALTQRTNDGPFLIITERSSQKYVQFAGTNLFFDLPHQTLSEAEMKRAAVILKHYGIEGPETYQIGSGPQGWKQTAFQKDLGGDVSQAILMVEAVLFEVYGFSRSCTIGYSEY
ncbi:MAG: hypothetical protein H0X66_05540 [Verrucomicrobia bacterium]|nr:hypothetical protein [Verrucomicrobiota bacterium]